MIIRSLGREYETYQQSRYGSQPRIATILLIVLCCVNYNRGLHDVTLSCSYDNVFVYGRWWCVFSALFVHGNIMHLLGNMLFLLLFGRGLESQVGSLRLLAIFLAGGALSMLFSCYYYPHNLPCVGASGAICTILATLMLFNPWKLSLLLNLFPMPLGVAGFTYLLLNIAGLYNDMKHPAAGDLQTAYMGHLSGFVIGLFFGVLLCPDWKKNLLISILQFLLYYLVLALIFYYLARR